MGNINASFTRKEKRRRKGRERKGRGKEGRKMNEKIQVL